MRVASRKGVPDAAQVASPSTGQALRLAVCSDVLGPDLQPGAPEPYPQVSQGSESQEKLGSQLSFNKFYFCTLQPLGPMLTIT